MRWGWWRWPWRTAPEAPRPVSAVAISGVALAGSAMMNPFVGGIFALVWGLTIAIDALRSGQLVSRLARHAVAVVPVALAIGWVMLNRMAEGGGSALQFGWLGEARKAPLETLAVSLGPALLAAAVGLLVGGVGRPTAPVLLTLLSLGLMYFARLNVDFSWIGFRAGQMILVAVPALIARGFVTSGARKALAVATAALVVAIGTPTVAIDTYNAQDVTNFAPSPNGPWTVTVTRDEQSGLAWLRANASSTAIVQMDPLSRERSTWSLIPSFAERRMGAGRPISLLGGTTDGSGLRGTLRPRQNHVQHRRRPRGARHRPIAAPGLHLDRSNRTRRLPWRNGQIRRRTGVVHESVPQRGSFDLPRELTPRLKTRPTPRLLVSCVSCLLVSCEEASVQLPFTVSPERAHGDKPVARTDLFPSSRLRGA